MMFELVNLHKTYSKHTNMRCHMDNTIVEQLLKIKEMNNKQEYTGKERRKEDDPAHFGHFVWKDWRRRQAGSIFPKLRVSNCFIKTPVVIARGSFF